MGEVYRARDTRLGRDVAIKVLPEALASDPERTARFQREAQLLAALNHPHIATIHGFEEVATPDTEQPPLRFLIMELVEGDTLAQRLGSGPIPVTEALAIARQIADALQAAHEKGIIHRDLKPANIVVSADGEVKVLDFGLAKALDATSGVAPGPQDPAYMATHSPTLSIAATQAGVILGTAAYMAPEQARGKVADKRVDIWAFGCVLYEMLTGRRAFEGEDAAQTLAFVMARDPDWTALRADVPPSVSMLLRGCLEKEPRKRIADISTATFAFDQAARLDAIVGRVLSDPIQNDASKSRVQKDPAYVRPRWRRVAPLAAALLIGAVIAAGSVWLLTRPSPPSVVRMTFATSGATALFVGNADRSIAITPDGSHVVYRGNGGQLLVRALDQLRPRALTGLGQEPRGLFVSPDGLWIGFFEGLFLKKVAITGGPSVTITPTESGGPRGATWGPDGTIIYAALTPTVGLQRVSAAGGDPIVLTKPDREHGEGDHLWPEFLPGGEAVLFTITRASGGVENAQVAVLDLRTGTTKVLVRGGSHAHYVRTGHLVYATAGTLRAVPFDLPKLEVTGTPAPVLEDVMTTAEGGVDAAIAANGTLVYLAGSSGSGDKTVVSADRQGRASPLPGIPPNVYRDVDVSPDGSRLALSTLNGDVWTYDVARATLTRLTTDPAPDIRPIWTPDGRRILFMSARAGYPQLFWRAADGSGADEQVLTRAKDLIELRGDGWSSDGRHLLFTEVPGNIQCAIGELPIDRASDVRMLVKNEFCNEHASLSPDGRWMAYDSTLSGRIEIYVERYPELGSRLQISTDGGNRPVWSRDRRELYFRSADGLQMFAASVRPGATLVADRPQVLFQFPLPAPAGTRPYAVTPDGRFIIITNAQGEGTGAPAPSLTLVLNWTEELKRLVPR
jgi:serine/threonine protein kinase